MTFVDKRSNIEHPRLYSLRPQYVISASGGLSIKTNKRSKQRGIVHIVVFIVKG